ncbi:MAG TPA: MinD/ParA family protein, partial [Acidimicrobiia bacterium]|nr:MinD/ParA family protein [Acidimicrobiia bacterium]
LAMVAPRDVVLVDLDLQFGDVAHNLRIEPDRTIADVLRFGADKDITALKAFLTPHPAGLYVLCAPDSPADMDDMDAERVGRVVRALSESFPYVVVDTGSGMDEFALSAFEYASDFVLVGVTDVPSVRSTRKAIEVLDRLGFKGARRHFILNRSDRQVGLGVKDIEETVGMRVDVAIPSTTLVTVSVNQGTPLLVSDEPSEPADALFDLVGRFAELPADVSRLKRKVRVR